MPSDTFFRLPEAKRQRIFEAAADEFAESGFSTSSINRIVKAAGIPRGSFYQYFADKEDLYAYVLEEISKEKINIISLNQMQAGRELNLYELLSSAMPPILSWAADNPRYGRIGLNMLEDNSAFSRRVLGKMLAGQNFLRELLLHEQQAGRIRAEVRVETVIWLFLSAVAAILRDYYEAASAEEAMRRVQALYDIICFGIVNTEDSL